ncbi:MAG: hypothetical protein C0631_07500 [Sedimenticola sp.]|jgi:hypothetical protein|nr:MAG: hypothetical protein C0631_07500 [Sedimenticola sp.]
MIRITTIALLASILVATGCSWVKPTPGGEKVRVLNADEVATCKELGKTTVSLVDKIAGIKRNPQKVQKELETLARTSAANIGGDTIVPISEIQDGQQRFAVYKCVGLPLK